MPRPALSLAAALAGMAAWLAPALGADEAQDRRTAIALRFVQGLRERGYYDLALEYLDGLGKAKDTPADLRAVLDYETGRLLLEEASKTADLERRREQLEMARGRLDAFVKANPKHPLAPEAFVQLARLLVERGHLAVLQADESKVAADRQVKRAQARDSFRQARAAYAQAEPLLKAAHEAFERFIPEGDPRKAARDRAHAAMLDAQLQRALVDYEDAQTYPPEDKGRQALLDKAIAAFKAISDAHRTQMAGFHARMWQGKCYEEKGDLTAAMGVYNELMEHPDPRLRPLQRQVGYFRIIVSARRKEYALAADDAARWLQANPGDRRSLEGLGVQLELAKNLLAQLDDLKGADREAAQKRAVDALGEVVRYYSPHKPEAIALLQKYRPRAAAGAAVPSNLSYDDAIAQADLAISSEDWGRAEALLKAAARRVNPSAESDRERRLKELERLDRARYLLAYCYFQDNRYYEAAVLAEHLARRRPEGGLSAKATQIGMAALVGAYNTYTRHDRAADLDRVAALARYTAETWPDSDEGDAARMTLGEILLGQGRYPEAASTFDAVRARSPKGPDARNKAGVARWRQSLVLRDKGEASQADGEAQAAVDLLKASLKAREDAGAAPVDPDRLGNACDLADIYLATGRPKEALALLDPLARAVGDKPRPDLVTPASRLLAAALRAHVATGQVDQALADMRRLEALGGPGATLTPLYFELGRLLKKEMDALQARGDQAGLARTQQAYQKFLEALVGSSAGQSYDSLQWAGEAMLALDQGEKAGEVFRRILETYSQDEAFRKAPGADARLLRTELRLVSALRARKEFAEAEEHLNALIERNKGLLDPLMEKGLLLEDQGRWAEASEHWRRLAARLGLATPKPVDYYEASYHVAFCLFKQGQAEKARQALRAVMRLSPKVGNDEMKAKYESLLRQLGTG